MLTRLDLRGTPTAALAGRLPRPNAAGGEPVAAVREILARYGFDGVAVHAARRHAPSPRFLAVTDPDDRSGCR